MRYYVRGKLSELGIPQHVLERYDEPHRAFHNWEHIEYVLNQNQLFLEDLSLLMAAVFHDIIYDPTSKTNEVDSANLWVELAHTTQLSDDVINEVYEMILDTRHISPPRTKKSKILVDADLNRLLHGNLSILIEDEAKIRKEFQMYDWTEYQKGRIDFLFKWVDQNPVIKGLISKLKHDKPSIAIYPGSFNPFHIGHRNILEKAEKVFDKVIIALGTNPSKSSGNILYTKPELFKYRQVLKYDGLLTDFVRSLPYPVTIVRGLRSHTDFDYELNQYRYLQEFDPKIKVVSIFCDKEFDHISSSMIRQATMMGIDMNKYILL